jgi:PAS domain S-box-containing protein
METTLVAAYPVPPNERERLAALHALDILDTDPEPAFDRIVNLAARLLNAPIALVSLVDQDRQWFKAKCGLEAPETAREYSFCTHAMLQEEPLVVGDATQDVRFWKNPLVTGEMSIRFYVGAPLRTSDGLGLGSLCVIDTVPRPRPSQEELDNLLDLAYLVSQQIEVRLSEKARRVNEARLQEAQRIAHVGHWDWDVDTQTGLWSDETYRLYGLVPQSGINRQRFEKLLPPEDREKVFQAVTNCLETGEPYAITHRIVRANGSVVDVEARGRLQRDSSGRFTKIVGTLLDVTARVRADTLLRQSKEELEGQVAQRTELLEREIEEHKLTQAIVSGQNRILQKIAEGLPIQQIFEMLLLFGQNEGGSACTGAILLKTEDGERLRWAAAPHLPEAIRAAIPEIKIGPGNGSSGEAAYLKQRVVLTNLGQSSWPAAALCQEHLGARSLVSTPILDEQNQVLGTVSFSCPSDYPTGFALRLQESCAHLAALVLQRDREQLKMQRWEQMFQHASWGMALASARTQKLVAVNPAYARMLGYAESELVGRCIFDVFGQVVMSSELLTADCFAARTNLAYESSWKSKSGEDLPVMIDIVPICDAAGVPLYWAANVKDVTEQKKVSKELREALKQAQIMADVAPQVVFTARTDGWVDYYNEKWNIYTGKTSEVSLGWNWQAVVHPDDLEQTVSTWTRSLESGEPYQTEVRVKRASDGAYRWHLGRALPLRGSSGEIVKWFGTVTDIHDQKTENERLETLVQARTEQLRRLLTEKETLLKELHHRVKNNLQIISSLLRMQAQKVSDAAAIAALSDTRQRVISIAMIHEQLYSNQQVNAIDFGEYARVLVNELFRCHVLEGRTISSRIEAGSVLLQIDQAIPCGLILNELVTNALKYAYPAGAAGEVVIALAEREGMVRLSVTDQGVGLPLGWNLKKSRSLGMPIVDLLAQQLGGELTVGGPPGACFVVRFPRE